MKRSAIESQIDPEKAKIEDTTEREPAKKRQNEFAKKRTREEVKIEEPAKKRAKNLEEGLG